MALQNFIVFEGIDGAGTSTQIECLRKRNKDGRFLFTQEPTSAPTGLFLRQMLRGDVKVSNQTAAYLFAADRNEHVNGSLLVRDDDRLVTGIRQAAQEGKIVVSDRYFFSSLAYQSVDADAQVARTVNSHFPLPALLFYFEISPGISLGRIGSRGTKEIYERMDFLSRTVDAYHRVLKEYEARENETGMEIVHVDASLPKDEVSRIIAEKIEAYLKEPL